MDELDADDKPLYSNKFKKFMARDIVQFVPYEECKNDHFRLAKEVLTELPGQVVEFFLKKGIVPRAAKEEQRKALEAKLSLRNKVDFNQVIDSFRQTQKQRLVD